MADDLVERLSDESDLCRNEGAEDVALLPDEAADAIDSLRKQVANLEARGIHTCHDKCQRPLCVAQRENERLREALKWYANPEIYKPHPNGPAFDRRDLSWHAISALAHKDVNA